MVPSQTTNVGDTESQYSELTREDLDEMIGVVKQSYEGLLTVLNEMLSGGQQSIWIKDVSALRLSVELIAAKTKTAAADAKRSIADQQILFRKPGAPR